MKINKKQKNCQLSIVNCQFFSNFAPQMSKSEMFQINLKGLKEDEIRLEYDVDDAFFASLDGAQLEHGALHVSVSIRKTAGLFELQFHTVGTVTVSCDLCLDDMEQPIEADNRLTVRLTTDNWQRTQNDVRETMDDELINVSEDEGVLDVSWFIYEFVMLAIPIKHVHAPGKCNHVMTEKLEELSAARSSDEAKETDPRWDALLKVKCEE